MNKNEGLFNRSGIGRHSRAVMDKKKILITRTDRLGDVVLSTPVIRAVRRAYPEAYIAFMVRPCNRDIVANNPDLDEVIIYDKYGYHKSLWSTFNFALKLRSEKFDMGIALHPTNRVHMIMYIAGIPARVGYDRKMAFLLTEKISHTKQYGEKHEIDYNLDMLRAVGLRFDRADRKPYIITSDNERKMVDAVKKTCVLGDRIIAFHVGASCLSKQWPVEKFAETADRLSQKYKYDIVLLGGEDTEVLSKKMISLMKTRANDLTGTLLLGEFAEFLSRCELFISNDSGPVHVAVAVGTPVIAIFGRKDPGLSPLRWGPVGEKDKSLHKPPPDCDICLAHACNKGFLCLKNVKVQDVINTADSILQRG